MVKTITPTKHNFLTNQFTSIKPVSKPKPPVKNKLAKYRYIDDDFKKMFTMMECIKRDRSIKNRLIDESGNKYNHYIQYFCSRADCLLCKRAKTKRYLQNRLVKTKYFVTISTTITASDVEREKDFDIKQSKYKQFRRDLRLFFDHLKIPFIGTLEIGEKGDLLHAHILIQRTKYSSIQLTDLAKGFFGYYVDSEIVNYGDGLEDYMSKVIPYISKMTKDTTLSKWNHTKILPAAHYIYSNLYRAKKVSLDDLLKVVPFEHWKEETIFSDKGVSDTGITIGSGARYQVFQKLMSQYVMDVWINNEKTRTPERAALWVLGYLLRKSASFLADIEDKIKKREYMKAIDKQSLEGSVFRLSAMPDPKLIDLKIMEARRRILKGVMREYERVIELSQEYNNVVDRYEKKDKLIAVYSRYFISSVINKRLISNLSIESEIKEKKVQSTGERLEFVTMKKMKTKKEVDPDKHLHYLSSVQNNLYLRLRKNRKQSEIDFSNKVWVNSVIRINPHLKKTQITQDFYYDSFGKERKGMLINYLHSAIDRMVKKHNGKDLDSDQYEADLLNKITNL